MAHYAFINEDNIVTEVIVGKMKMILQIYQKVLQTGKPGIQTLEVRLVKELL